MAYAQEKINPYDGDQRPKGEQVEAMFDNIASTYDLLNHWLSFGIDRFWRKAAINAMRRMPHADLLDVATGTGDFAILQAKELTPRSVIATDLSEGMMEIGRRKVDVAGLKKRVHFQREDCMNLSFADGTFDAVTVAYGVRNFQDLDKGLREMHRVLKTDGSAVILELCTPRKFPMKQLFWLYAHVVMPFVGRLVSKDFSAYSYLPATMAAFPQGEKMREILLKAGFGEVTFRRFTFGLCTLYIAKKTET